MKIVCPTCDYADENYTHQGMPVIINAILYIIGIVLLFVFPIGTVLAILLFWFTSSLNKLKCPRCGSRRVYEQKPKSKKKKISEK